MVIDYEHIVRYKCHVSENKLCTRRDWLKGLIGERYSSVADFADRIGAKPRTVFYWIDGERNPGAANKKRIVRELGDRARRAFLNEDYPREAQANG